MITYNKSYKLWELRLKNVTLDYQTFWGAVMDWVVVCVKYRELSHDRPPELTRIAAFYYRVKRFGMLQSSFFPEPGSEREILVAYELKGVWFWKMLNDHDCHWIIGKTYKSKLHCLLAGFVNYRILKRPIQATRRTRDNQNFDGIA